MFLGSIILACCISNYQPYMFVASRYWHVVYSTVIAQLMVLILPSAVIGTLWLRKGVNVGFLALYKAGNRKDN